MSVILGSTGITFPDATTQTTAATGIPTGQTVLYGSPTVPSGYLKCDGTTYNISSYTTLASAIGSIPTSLAQYTATSLSGYQFQTYQNSTFILGNYSSTYKYSTNGGVSFSSTAATGNFGAKLIFYTGTNYWALGSDPNCANAYGVWYTSSLANTGWTQVGTPGTTISINAGGSNGTRGVCFGAGVNNWYTTTGSSWTAGGNLPTGGVVYNNATIPYGASLFAAPGRVSTTPCVFTSADGVAWTQRTWPGAGFSVVKMTYQNSLFIGIDTSYNICSSSDGITWTYKGTIPSLAGFTNIVYLAATGLYYASGYYSLDLITWYVLPVAPGAVTYTGTEMVTDGTSIVANGYGTTWKPYPYNTSTQFIVPNFGGNALGPAPVNGAYYNIKT